MLKISGLSKSFGALQALDKVDIEIKEGEIHGIIGPNGSGKTTLFNCITGILKPNEGKVIFKGEDITGLKPNIIANKGIHRTFQAGKLVSNLTVLENIMCGFVFTASWFCAGVVRISTYAIASAGMTLSCAGLPAGGDCITVKVIDGKPRYGSTPQRIFSCFSYSSKARIIRARRVLGLIPAKGMAP